METCKAVVQEGQRKGEKCQFPPGENEYCGRHQRNKVFDDGVLQGKKWCRFFFRGCNNELVEGDTTSCCACRNAINKKQGKCSHEGCHFKIKEGKYCKKHERDIYYDEEKEKNIKYCDVARGCFTILTTNKKSCTSCLEKSAIKDNERYNNRKNMILASQEANSTKQTCIKCQADFEPFETRYSKNSMNCKSCSEKQATQDKKREDRVRNYKEEHLKHLEFYYKNYIKDALKREKGDFQINFEDFSELVKGSCHYCKFKSDTETNGIDRINNDIGYLKENCVTACWKCNRMKHFYHPRFFVKKCKILCKILEPTKEFYKEWSSYYTRTTYRNFKAYKREAEQRELPFELTEAQWDWLSKSACYLCGYQSMYGIGIDRVDNTIRKYTLDNCRPCCGSCNSMKNDLSFDDFIAQCKLVSDTWKADDSFQEVPISKNPLKENETQNAERKHWKAASLYSAIMSDSAIEFWNSHSDVFTENEYDVLCVSIKKAEKDTAIDMLKNLIAKLKKRKFRLQNNV